jgi:Zn finger protein HypA/HybF involved in hydrogenase expression
MAKLKKLDLEEVKRVVKETSSAAEACRKLGMSTQGSATRFRKFLDDKQIDYSNWTGQLWSKGKTSLDDNRLRKTKDTSEIFVENSNASSFYVRSLLIKHKLKEYKCECGITNEWNGKSINLQMDHINGNRKDHRLENLRWLCPNCHSQTDTFCARNGNKQKVSDEELKEALLTSPNIRQALAKFDLENGGNYRRAKRLIKKVLDESNQSS